jgi:hypothetical protein
MKTKTIKLYEYDELSKQAQEKAFRTWAQDVYDPYLPSHLGNLVKEELDERKIKYDTDSINCLYSLGHCQGDGLMFEGKLYPSYGKGREYTVIVKNSGRYCHKYSRTIDMRDEEGVDADEEGRDYKDFVAMYEAICDKVRDAGYAEIEYQQSEEAFREACEANEWTFRENGTMENI